MSFSIYEIAPVEPGAAKAPQRSTTRGPGDEGFASVIDARKSKDYGAAPADRPVVGDTDGAPLVERDAAVEGVEEAAGAIEAAEASTLDNESADTDTSVLDKAPEDVAPVESPVESKEATADHESDEGEHADHAVAGIDNAISKIESNGAESAKNALDLLIDGPGKSGGAGGVPGGFVPLGTIDNDGLGDRPLFEDLPSAPSDKTLIELATSSHVNAAEEAEEPSGQGALKDPDPDASNVSTGSKASNAAASTPQTNLSEAPTSIGPSVTFGLLDLVVNALDEALLSARVDALAASAKKGAVKDAPTVFVKDLPKEIGEITIKLDPSSKEGGVRIVVQGAAVKELLESDSVGLKAELAGRGIAGYSIEIAGQAEAAESRSLASGAKGVSMPVVTIPTDDVVRAASVEAASASVAANNVTVHAPDPTVANAKAGLANRAGLADRAGLAVAQPAEPTVQAAAAHPVDTGSKGAAQRTKGLDNAISKVSANALDGAEKGLKTLADGPGAGLEAARALKAAEAAIRMAGSGSVKVPEPAAGNGFVQTPLNSGAPVDPGAMQGQGGAASMAEAFNPGGAEGELSTALGGGGNANSSFARGGQTLKYDNAGRLIEFAAPLGKGVDPITVAVKKGVARPASVPTAERFEVFRQIGRGLRMSIAGGGKEVRVRLVPNHLGEIILKVTGEENNVSAKIIVENAAVKGILESDAGRLRALFSENGLELNDYSVEVGSRGSNSRDLNPWLNARGEGSETPEDKAADGEQPKLPHMPYGDIGSSGGGSLDLFV